MGLSSFLDHYASTRILETDQLRGWNYCTVTATDGSATVSDTLISLSPTQMMRQPLPMLSPIKLQQKMPPLVVSTIQRFCRCRQWYTYLHLHYLMDRPFPHGSIQCLNTDLLRYTNKLRGWNHSRSYRQRWFRNFSDTFNITVTNTNDTPTVANAIPNQTIAEDSSLSFNLLQILLRMSIAALL